MIPEEQINITADGGRLSGKFIINVFDEDGTIIKTQEQKNLILNGGMDMWGIDNLSPQPGGFLYFCHVGTGTTSNVKDFTGSTYDQTGTSVTRQTGTDSFVSGDVGNVIKFTGGSEVTIVSLVSGTEVTVDVSQTITGEGLKIYDTTRVQLDNWLATKAGSTTYQLPGVNRVEVDYQTNPDKPLADCYCSYLFDATQVQGNTITEMGVGNQSGSTSQLFSRILLDDPVPLGAGQQIGVTYVLTVQGDFTPVFNVDPNITGYPIAYDIDSIVDQGGNTALVTITPEPGDDHHYLVGDEIIIENAVRTRIALTGLTSTATEFTGTTVSAHGFTAGDTIVIEGVTPSAYNATWTVATTPTSTTFTVTTAINPGAGTGGNVRQGDPTTWWNGSWNVSAIGTNTVTIDVPSGIPDAGDGGALTNDGRVTVRNRTFPGNSDSTILNKLNGVALSTEIPNVIYAFYTHYHNYTSTDPWLNIVEDGNEATSFGGFGSLPSPSNQSFDFNEYIMSPVTYVNGNYYTEWVRLLAVTEANSDRIKQIFIGRRIGSSMYYYGGLYITFNAPQKKRNTYTLRINVRYSWTREITA